eukprot:SAG11_NODE_241_length_11781_cov_8.401900_6_plen_509_part_00
MREAIKKVRAEAEAETRAKAISKEKRRAEGLASLAAAEEEAAQELERKKKEGVLEKEAIDSLSSVDFVDENPTSILDDKGCDGDESSSETTFEGKRTLVSDTGLRGRDRTSRSSRGGSRGGGSGGDSGGNLSVMNGDGVSGSGGDGGDSGSGSARSGASAGVGDGGGVDGGTQSDSGMCAGAQVRDIGNGDGTDDVDQGSAEIDDNAKTHTENTKKCRERKPLLLLDPRFERASESSKNANDDDASTSLTLGKGDIAKSGSMTPEKILLGMSQQDELPLAATQHKQQLGEWYVYDKKRDDIVEHNTEVKEVNGSEWLAKRRQRQQQKRKAVEGAIHELGPTFMPHRPIPRRQMAATRHPSQAVDRPEDQIVKERGAVLAELLVATMHNSATNYESIDSTFLRSPRRLLDENPIIGYRHKVDWFATAQSPLAQRSKSVPLTYRSTHSSPTLPKIFGDSSATFDYSSGILEQYVRQMRRKFKAESYSGLQGAGGGEVTLRFALICYDLVP